MNLQELYKTNPDFFNKDWYGELISDYTNIEVGAGWYELVAEVAKNAPEGYYAQQIKEKFGALRIYVSNNTNDNDKILNISLDSEFMKLIAKVEDDSMEICENCSSTEDVDTRSVNYWIKTLCKECRNKC